MIKHIAVTVVLISSLSVAANQDPMRPPQFAPVEQRKAAPTKTSFSVQQIKTGATGTSAIVNGKLVKEGDTVSGARVVRITSDKVVLKYRQKLKTLSLLSNTKHSGE